MANNQNLKDAIAAVIKANGNNEITGEVLQQALLSIINQFGSGSLFKNEITPASSPGNPDSNYVYVGTKGSYPNFDNVVIPGDFGFVYKENGSWNAISIDVGLDPIKENIELLGDKIDDTNEVLEELKESVTDDQGADFNITDSNGNIVLNVSGETGQTSVNDLFAKKLSVGDVEFREISGYQQAITDEAGNIGSAINLNGTQVPDISKVIPKELVGLKIHVHGDSISDPGSGIPGSKIWWARLRDKYKCIITVDAQSGSGITQTDYLPWTPLVNPARWQTAPLDVNVILIFMGTNDANYLLANLGTITDNVTTTWYGALNYVYNSLTTRYPNAKIIHMIPLHRGDIGTPEICVRPGLPGIPFQLFINAIYEVAKIHGVETIDTRDKSGLTPVNMRLADFAQQIGSDNSGIHPLPKRHINIMRPVAAHLINSLLNIN